MTYSQINSAVVQRRPRQVGLRPGLLLVALGCLLQWAGMVEARSATALALGTGSGGPGEAANVGVQFQGDGVGVALQFDVLFDAARLSAGVAVKSAATIGHEVESSSPSAGVMRVVIYSLGNEPLANGSIAQVSFRVKSPAVAGTFPLVLTNIIVANAAAARVQPVTAANGSVVIRDSLAPVMELPMIAGNGQVTLRVRGQDGLQYTVQASTDLATWQNLATGAATGGFYTYTDTTAGTQTYRYYRALLAE